MALLWWWKNSGLMVSVLGCVAWSVLGDGSNIGATVAWGSETGFPTTRKRSRVDVKDREPKRGLRPLHITHLHATTATTLLLTWNPTYILESKDRRVQRYPPNSPQLYNSTAVDLPNLTPPPWEKNTVWTPIMIPLYRQLINPPHHWSPHITPHWRTPSLNQHLPAAADQMRFHFFNIH